MSRFLNNFCEDLVNGSNPKYAGSQISPSEQVAWQLKKEEEARQAIYAESLKMHEAQTKRDFTPSFTPSYSTPSFTPSYSTPSFSTSFSFQPSSYGSLSSTLPSLKGCEYR